MKKPSISSIRLGTKTVLFPRYNSEALPLLKHGAPLLRPLRPTLPSTICAAGHWALKMTTGSRWVSIQTVPTESPKDLSTHSPVAVPMATGPSCRALMLVNSVDRRWMQPPRNCQMSEMPSHISWDKPCYSSRNTTSGGTTTALRQLKTPSPPIRITPAKILQGHSQGLA